MRLLHETHGTRQNARWRAQVRVPRHTSLPIKEYCPLMGCDANEPYAQGWLAVPEARVEARPITKA